MKLANCNAHANTGEHGLSCYKIRHDDGRTATQEEVWGEIERAQQSEREGWRYADELEQERKSLQARIDTLMPEQRP